MKIVVGCFYHETNTFNPFPTTIEDFVCFEGEEILDRIAASKVFEEADVTVIPSIYATALSSGFVQKEAFAYFTNKIIDTLKREQDIDGVWLHLHGAMVVEGIGSGELALMKEIRQVIGKDIPISLTLDIHGNMALDFHQYVNIVRSYRTVPHTDQRETEMITGRLLVQMIKDNTIVQPAFVRLPLMICGEKALGDQEPLRSIFSKLEEVEQRAGIATASFFICHAWSDTENTVSSIFVTPENPESQSMAEEVAKEIARYVFERRKLFVFDAIALEPERAIIEAIQTEDKPVFISDSGDNTTAGATGMNTDMLRLLLQTDLGNKKVVLAAIYDAECLQSLQEKIIGEEVVFTLGTNVDINSQPIEVKGVLKEKGKLLGYLNAESEEVGEVCTVTVGNIDVVIANGGSSFITLQHFTAAGLTIEDYDIVIVKQGYLFPELSEISKKDLLALTDGTTHKMIEKINYQHRQKPIYPMEQDTQFMC